MDKTLKLICKKCGAKWGLVNRLSINQLYAEAKTFVGNGRFPSEHKCELQDIIIELSDK